MKTRKNIILIIPLLVVIIIAYLSIYKFNDGKTEVVMDDEIVINIDYVYRTTDELEDMVATADVVLVGKYDRFDRSWNMARSPEDINQEDKDNYVEGHIYNFSVDEVLKGTVDSDSIEINLRYLDLVKHLESNEVVSPDGIVEKEATEVTVHELEVIDPLYIKPELNKKYILFLAKDTDFMNYYGAIEPFSILIHGDGTTELQSTLLNDDSDGVMSVSNHKIDEKKVVVMAHVDGQIKDDLTGKSYEEVITLIKALNK